MNQRSTTDRYRINGEYTVPRELADLARRRTLPFLNGFGLMTRSVSHLLQEAYMLGVRDGASVALGLGGETPEDDSRLVRSGSSRVRAYGEDR